MRWMQLTLVEDDPIHYDAAFWIDYCRRTQSEGACLSGGGCVAYYPTEVPFHHRSACLGDRDVLGELITGCRKQGMTILIRTDPHATYDDAKEAHPDWIAVDADGKPRRHWQPHRGLPRINRRDVRWSDLAPGNDLCGRRHDDALSQWRAVRIAVSQGIGHVSAGKKLGYFRSTTFPAGGDKFLSISVDQSAVRSRVVGRRSRGVRQRLGLVSRRARLPDRTDGATAGTTANRKQENSLKRSPTFPTFLRRTISSRCNKRCNESSTTRFAKSCDRLSLSVATTNPRYGGVITNAAVLSMTSGPLRTQPIARGAWVIEVVFNDPPLRRRMTFPR